MSPVDVVREIFDSIRREIIDEVNIPAECLSSPQLLGVMRNVPSAGRPSAEFYSKYNYLHYYKYFEIPVNVLLLLNC